MKDYILPAKEAYKTRAALLGGYLRGPLILIMCGVQGSGKSTFCEKLLDGSDEGHWMHFSQDTIRSGKPGKRTVVEKKSVGSFACRQFCGNRSH